MITFPPQLLKSKTFFTADLHFGHARIMTFCNRPFESVDQMDKTLISNWNEIVPHGSTVYIIGDFAMYDHAKYIHQLNGKKILIEGNHDKMSLEVKKLFTEVHPFLRRNFFGHDITLCHYAMKSWANSIHGSLHAYGHSHGRIKEYDDILSCDVGVDLWNYYPVPFEIFKAKMATKIKKDRYDYSEANEHVEENKSANKVIWENYVTKSLQTRSNGVCGNTGSDDRSKSLVG